MQYPLIDEYIEAIRSAEENFDQYKALRLVLDDKGNPVMSSGNFGVVFKMQDEQTKRLYAVKCFTRDQKGRHANYRKIAEELEFVSSPYLVHFRFLEKELFVDTSQGEAEDFPVLVMDWVEGEPLDRYLRTHLRDAYALQLLAYRFCRMGAWLLSQPFAHGDLKPDNILVKADGSLVLVDYDGMFVPAMQGEQAGELGSPHFRHPLRTAADFNEHIDDFSIATIALSLKAIALQPSLYDQFAVSDRLLFAASDYLDLGKSAVLPALCSLTSNTELSTLLSTFLLAHAKNSLGMISFRLFLLQEPVKPKVEVWRTDVTDEDRAQAIEDEYGVLYSPDGLRLLWVPPSFSLSSYQVKKGTTIICDEAFGNAQLVFGGDWDTVCEGHSSLVSVVLPNTVKAIGDCAFCGCESLTTINIPNSVTTIGDCAFSGCKSLTTIIIPNSVTTIGSSAFKGCESLTKINIPNNVTTIRKSTFEYCSSLTSINIPNSVITIGDNAFCGCKSLTFAHIPKSITTIGVNPFQGCKQIALTCHSPYYYIDDGLLISTKGKLIVCLSDKPNIAIPNTVTTIGDKAFRSREFLTSIHLPDTVSAIGDEVFCGCKSLTSIHLPDSVTTIGIMAFYECCSLTSIHLPDSVTTIEGGAFCDCI